MKKADSLSPQARKLYSQIQDQWQIAEQPGCSILLTAMECWDQMREARIIIRRDGAIVKDRFGQDKLHPAVQLLKEARAHFLASVKALNLDLGSLEEKN